MKTRSGASYQVNMSETRETGDHTEATAMDSAQLIKVLMEERQRRDQEVAEERQRREQEVAEERRQREREVEQQRKQMQEQMDLLMKLVRDQSENRPITGSELVTVGREVKFSKLTETDDIQAYLMTFERTMQAFKVAKEQWVYQLVPQLTGKAQQAFAAMETSDSGDYDLVEAAILKRYNITEETYRQCLRSIRLKEEESHVELAVRAHDLTKKWMKECKDVEDVIELVAMEQLLETLPTGPRIWLRERKPQTAAEAGQLADDYVQARGQGNSLHKGQKGGDVSRRPLGSKPRCDNCGKNGHRARECWKGAAKPGQKDLNKEKEINKEVTCWKCFHKGHIAANCPGATAMYCDGTQRKKPKSYPRAIRPGVVDGTCVEDIMLDTSSSRTLIRADLVHTEKPVEGEISIRCAHGDIITYPLAKVEIEIGGEHFIVEAGVVDKLPVSVLLGWDVPQQEDLLQDRSIQKEALQTEDTMAVITRAQKERNKEEAAALAYKEHMSGAVPHSVQEDPSKGKEDEVPKFQFAEELFTEGRTKPRLSRSQKREHNLQFIQEQTPKHPLEMTAGELSQLQEEDSSLDAVCWAVKGEASTAGSGFFRRDGLIYRKWTPPGQNQEEWQIEQLVVPTSCRKAVLQLAHAIP